MTVIVCDHGHPLGECPECQRETVYRTAERLTFTPQGRALLFERPTNAPHSAPFVPTEAQMQSPLLMALYHRTGTTEREAIEALYQHSAEVWRIAERLAVFQPIGSILAGSVTFTNPTADKLGAEGHARTLAAILAEERERGRRDERARVTRIRNKAFAGKVLDDDMRKLLADFDGMLLRGEDDAT